MQRYYLVRLVRNRIKKVSSDLSKLGDDDIYQVITAFTEVLSDECVNPRGVHVRCFGSFKRLPSRQRETIYNPYKRQYEPMKEPEKLRIRFRPSKLFLYQATKAKQTAYEYE